MSLSDSSGQPGWMERMAENRRGIALLSALESTFVPIPLETILVPLMIGSRKSAWSLAAAALAGCLVGALVFYAVGYWLFDPVVRPALAWVGAEQDFNDIKSRLEGANLFWAIFVISISPAPMQLATLGAGAVGGSLPLYLAAVFASRGLRYFGLALLVHLFGERIEKLDLPMGKIMVGLVLLSIVYWAVTRFL